MERINLGPKASLRSYVLKWGHNFIKVSYDNTSASWSVLKVGLDIFGTLVLVAKTTIIIDQSLWSMFKNVTGDWTPLGGGDFYLSSTFKIGDEMGKVDQPSTHRRCSMISFDNLFLSQFCNPGLCAILF